MDEYGEDFNPLVNNYAHPTAAYRQDEWAAIRNGAVTESLGRYKRQKKHIEKPSLKDMQTPTTVVDTPDFQGWVHANLKKFKTSSIQAALNRLFGCSPRTKRL